jgi:hypothetical protein
MGVVSATNWAFNLWSKAAFASGNHLRITTRRIECASGIPVSSERYDRGLTDAFAIQDDTVHSIASAAPKMLLRLYLLIIVRPLDSAPSAQARFGRSNTQSGPMRKATVLPSLQYFGRRFAHLYQNSRRLDLERH